MKQYGFMKATEFSKKQINVIFAKAKSGSLNIEKWFISKLYDLADYYGYDDNGNVAEHETKILKILDAIFSNDNEVAQMLINDMQDDIYRRSSVKFQKTVDRSLLIA